MNRIHDRWQRDGTGKVKRYGLKGYGTIVLRSRISDIGYRKCFHCLPIAKKRIEKEVNGLRFQTVFDITSNSESKWLGYL